jgi:hypothetical protein
VTLLFPNRRSLLLLSVRRPCALKSLESMLVEEKGLQSHTLSDFFDTFEVS